MNYHWYLMVIIGTVLADVSTKEIIIWNIWRITYWTDNSWYVFFGYKNFRV